ncbi:hypothetical protein CDCA_CDCA05G1721 [Cyanidium caldarium]|uniref:Uncharacterized protein n=1 Tax=Cyanidium caldarium TaxID=2771 RepID=A0AAV9IUA7_CYACA|nr:hypothetical protein CDCA_CDCA05G1721 [Cyanidium caldarium]
MALSVGELLFFCVEVPSVVLVTALLLYRYPARRGGCRTPWYAYVAVGAAWFMALAIFILLPADLAQALHQRCVYVEAAGQRASSSSPSSSARLASCPASVVPSGTIGVFWQVVYWSVFFLGWLVLPLLRSYLASGGFTVRQRLWHAVRENLIYGAVLAVLLGALLLWLGLARGISFSTLRGLLIGLNNAIGLLMLMVLLGYGLVHVPRALWHRGNLRRRLRYCEFRATELADRRDDAVLAVAKVLGQLHVMEARLRRGEIRRGVPTLAFDATDEGGGSAVDHPVVNLLVRRVEVVRQLIPVQADDSDMPMPRPLRNMDVPDVIDEAALCALHCRMRDKLFEYRKANYLWRRRCDQAFHLQDVIKWRESVQAGAPHAETAQRVRQVRAAGQGRYARLGALEARRKRWQLRQPIDEGPSGEVEAGDEPNGAASADTEPVDEAVRVVHMAEIAAAQPQWRYTAASLYWHAVLKPFLLRAAAVGVGALAALLVFTEVTLWTVLLRPPLNLSAVSLLMHVRSLPAFLIQAVAFLAIAFHGFIAYTSIFHLNVYRWYELVPGYVDGNSLCVNAAVLSRFFTPLCYNLIFVLHENHDAVVRLLTYQQPQLGDAPGFSYAKVPVTAFERLMGTMDVLPIFGGYFNYWFPCAIVLSLLGTLCRVWSRLMRALGVAQFGFEEDGDDAATTTTYETMGRHLLARERKRRQMREGAEEAQPEVDI